MSTNEEEAHQLLQNYEGQSANSVIEENGRQMRNVTHCHLASSTSNDVKAPRGLLSFINSESLHVYPYDEDTMTRLATGTQKMSKHCARRQRRRAAARAATDENSLPRPYGPPNIIVSSPSCGDDTEKNSNSLTLLAHVRYGVGSLNEPKRKK